ncbi:MAG TPA: DUF1780 domain-containing protein [Candidatus Binatia bacterium]
MLQLQDAAEETRKFLSDHESMERAVVAAFLRAVGVKFCCREVEKIKDAQAPDVRFRGAAFEVCTAFEPGRRPQAEWREKTDRLRAATSLEDLSLEIPRGRMSTPKAAFGGKLSHESVARLAATKLAKKATRYGPTTCASFDALIYVNHRAHFDQASPLPPSEVLAELATQGWRSVSAFTWPVGWVISASPAAPEWLQQLVGPAKDEGDSPLRTNIFRLDDDEE